MDPSGTNVIVIERLVFAALTNLRWFCLTIPASGVLCCSPSRSYLVTLKGITFDWGLLGQASLPASKRPTCGTKES